VDIYIGAAACEGATELSAFDACLLEVGLGNLNLIYLSSIIPAGATLLRQLPPDHLGVWGHRSYCVMAQARTSIVGHEVWAGIGWIQNQDSGRGLFAEAKGASEAEVRLQLDRTLDDMSRRRTGEQWSPPEMAVAGATCTGSPICALSAAAFATEGWH
jgi:arginine decarboxylase